MANTDNQKIRATLYPFLFIDDQGKVRLCKGGEMEMSAIMLKATPEGDRVNIEASAQVSFSLEAPKTCEGDGCDALAVAGWLRCTDC